MHLTRTLSAGPAPQTRTQGGNGTIHRSRPRGAAEKTLGLKTKFLYISSRVSEKSRVQGYSAVGAA